MDAYDKAEIGELGTLALGRELHLELQDPPSLADLFKEARRQRAKDLAVDGWSCSVKAD